MLSEAKTRKKILSSATALFASSAYNKVTIRKIADMAGVSPSLIIYYFISKENLYCQVFEEFFPEIECVIKQLKQQDNISLPLIVNSYVDILRQNALIPVLLHRELLSLSETEAKNRLTNKLLKTHKKSLITLLKKLPECNEGNQNYFYTIVMSLATYPFISEYTSEPEDSNLVGLQDVYDTVFQAAC
ncbi:hypothetical protein A3K86_06580 [Photobacterium jeanii]|uniref:HTH tetR-type domain-containing protein n=1 Tax=Photobacterium jeanii TaxID=858640 RepID=A0A178KMH9_9GAMM|nr:TetR/AcrR family transcriptional regulator [Photobacterium jeanii]OAN18549.1 hypothetical protein A3K86_06580 [Photobacterium jeanii]PST91769.1 TetR/AcrR family transcriptional regulator [Photobacterium jeanii]